MRNKSLIQGQITMPFEVPQLILRLRSQAVRLFERWQAAARLRREEEARSRAIQDEKSWLAFEVTMYRLSATGMRVGEISGVRQHARTGTKGWIRWTDTDEKIAFWAQGNRLTRGQLLALRCHEGGGEHHGEWVFYIDDMEILPWGIYNGWLNHQARQRQA